MSGYVWPARSACKSPPLTHTDFWDIVDYYHVAFAHAQKASALSFANTGKVENVELVDCYPVSIRNTTQISIIIWI